MKRSLLLAMSLSLAAACGGATDDNELLAGGGRRNNPLPGEAAPSDPGAQTGGDNGGSGGASSSGNPGTAADNAFTGAPAYAAKNGPSTRKDDHPGPNGTATKANCMEAGCHTGNGEGPRFLAAGSVFVDKAGTTPAANVEVRFRDGNGNTVSAYTDNDGNFFVRQNQGGASVTLPATTGVRDAMNTRIMLSPISDGACNSAACHGGPQGVIYLAP